MLTRTSYCDTWLRPTHTLTPHLGLIKWDQNHIWAWSLGPSFMDMVSTASRMGWSVGPWALVTGTNVSSQSKMRHAWNSARRTFHMRVKGIKAGIAAACCDCHSKRSQGLDQSQLGYRTLTLVSSL